MRRQTLSHWAAPVLVAALALQSTSAKLGIAGVLNPESPEVRQAVEKAIKFLESEEASDTRLGAKALVGLALVKNNAEPKHPRIVAAVKSIQAAVRDRDPQQLNLDIYSTGLSIIFLVDLDPTGYRQELKTLLAYLQAVQKPHGGWGYSTKETGDTSMTQYAVLSSWEATQAGFRVPLESIEAVTLWLIKTQDPSGGFGYQGVVSQTSARVKQHSVRHSLSAAGLGSVYICADLLGLVEKVERDADVPRALREVKPKEQRKPDRPKTRIDPRLIREAQSAGNKWMRANYQIDPEIWTHYYLYALERYWSFREAAEGYREENARWYTEGAHYLIRTQAANGSWQSKGGLTADTAFGVLFLSRSSKKSIEKARAFGPGMLISGRGLPLHTDRVGLRMGKVVPLPPLETAESLFAVLDNPEHPDYDHAAEALAEVPAQEVAAWSSRYGEKLRALAEAVSPKARMAAIRVLGNARDLDYVPTLIHALNDPDPAVVREATRGLQQVSRRLGGGELPDHPTPADRQAAIAQWKAWYLAVRPDAEVDD